MLDNIHINKRHKCKAMRLDRRRYTPEKTSISKKKTHMSDSYSSVSSSTGIKTSKKKKIITKQKPH